MGERLDLKRSAISGARWSSTTTVYTLALQFIQVAVLAHYLSPASFGLVGLVVVAVGFALAFADLGLTHAIVQRQDGDDGPTHDFHPLQPQRRHDTDDRRTD